MTYIMSCVWLDYMVKYFQCKNCVGSSLKTKKCVASFLVPGDKKKRQFFERRLSFLFGLFTLSFSLFSLLSNCRFQRKDKREKRREKVALLRKALNYIIICGIIQSEVMTNEQSFAR